MSESERNFGVVYRGKQFRVDAPGGEHLFFFERDKTLTSLGRFAYSGGDLRDMDKGEPAQAKAAVEEWLRDARTRNPNF
jgi:hypothetical protein